MTVSELIIRPALAEDGNRIRDVAQLAYSKYIQRIGQAPAPMVADFESQIKEQWVKVACCNSVIAGFVVFYPRDDHMHLENVAVRPQFAGKGIGKQLINHVENVALQQGRVAVELYTNEAMTENLAFYPRMGYVEIARKRQNGFNRVFFRKEI